MRLLTIAPAVALLASLTSLTLPAGAQQTTAPATARPTALPIVPGARVRVSATTLVAPLIGNFLEMKGDTAVFIEAGAGRGLWTLTVDQITKLELSRGDTRYNRRPMLKGAAIGAPAGALAFWAVTGLTKPGDKGRRFDRTTTAGVGFLVGGAVGAIVGSRFAQEGWMKLPLPNRIAFVPSRRDGMTLQLGFTF